MTERFGARAIALAVMAGLFVLLLIFAVSQCDKRRSQGAQAKVDHSQGQAAQTSATDAINTVTTVGENASASEDLSRQNERDIRAAEGASVKVGSGVNAAGRSALCKRKAYASDPKCKALTGGQK